MPLSISRLKTAPTKIGLKYVVTFIKDSRLSILSTKASNEHFKYTLLINPI